jgi:3-isopropylmalate/(R)-2-methylmalate dehydratase large subunit
VGMTITEKILADHAGKDKVTPGEIVTAQLDAVLANDITGALAIKELSKMGYDSVFDTDKVIFVIDHFAPSPNIKAASSTMFLKIQV